MRVTTEDDGDGGAHPALGIGLTGLIDRLESAGGTLVISSPLGEGTIITARLPFAPDRTLPRI